MVQRSSTHNASSLRKAGRDDDERRAWGIALMWLVRIIDGVVQPVSRMDDFVTARVGFRETKRPREPRAWRIERGAAAISQSPEGAIASARRVLEQPDGGPRVANTLAELIAAMKGTV